MCTVYGETAAVWNHYSRNARKAHRCDVCSGAIEPRQRYFLVTALMDDYWATAKLCALCEIFFEAFGNEHRFWPWPAELHTYLTECVRDEGDTASRWTPMIEAIEARRAA